jgi:CBS domain-containing protein
MNKLQTILKNKGETVHTIHPDSSVYEAVAKMVEHNIGALVVTQDDHVVGIITERDYLRNIAIKGRSSRTTPVRQIMTRKVIYIEPERTVEEALSIITEARIRHLPVMQGNTLKGIVSIGDCVKQVIHLQRVEISYLKDYISDSYPGPSEPGA